MEDRGSTTKIVWTEVASIPSDAEPFGFWKAVELYINKPHVVNRRLCGTKILSRLKYSSLDCTSIIQQSSEYLKCTDISDCKDLFDGIGSQTDNAEILLQDLFPRQLDRNKTIRQIVILDFANCVASFIPLVYVNDNKDGINPVCRDLIYQFAYHHIEGKCSIMINVVERKSGFEHGDLSVKWLKETLLKKFGKWSEESNLQVENTSLCLVSVEKYNALYQQLKVRYGQELVKIWPEKTDPYKFVYEDVAIAAYLMLIWEQERDELQLSSKQSFVDLGCGNGLLVYILSAEGHRGLGIDVRCRKIWKLYPQHTVLKEMPVNPSNSSLFPDYDWLIGNHSDELTPWIPVMAARSSFMCRFFVLPCCHHDFDSKFSQRVSGVSQYRAYLDFVKLVGEKCGFHIQEDTLRIPSTKRVCFIGKSRNYSQDKESEIDQSRVQFISSRCKKKPTQNNSHFTNSETKTNTDNSKHLTEDDLMDSNAENESCIKAMTDSKGTCHSCGYDGNSYTDSKVSHSSLHSQTSDTLNCKDYETENLSNSVSAQSWAADFQARSNVETVRNCTRVAIETREHIIHTVFDAVMKAEDAVVKTLVDGHTWRKGGSVPINSIADMFDSNILQQLKAECGGLQTLLRNYHHVFQVSQGSVRLRDWLEQANHQSVRSRRKANSNKMASEKPLKTKLCWFHIHHPDGCPLNSQTCNFAHGEDDIIITNKHK